MTKTHRGAYRRTPETTQQIKELAVWLAPGIKLSESDVVSMAVNELHERIEYQRTTKEEKRR